MSEAVASNQAGISLVSLRARHLGFSKGFDDGRVYNTDAMTSLIELESQGI
jgi:hypothetical protein